MSCPGKANGENMAIVVLGGNILVTIGSVGMRGGCVGGSVDDEETKVWGDVEKLWINEAKRGSTDKRSC